MSDIISDQIKRFNSWTARATNDSNKMNEYRLNCEEFYFSDVQDTLTQFTRRQKNTIDTTYNIPVSTKISYALIEQLLAFLTGSKPFPRLISSTDSTSEFTQSLEQGYHGVWYESKANRELKRAIRDALVSGSGYLMVRKNNFYNETTFNTVIDYVSWKNIYVDPDSKEEDFSDAEYIMYINSVPRYKAEKEYGVKFDETDAQILPEGIQFVSGTVLGSNQSPSWSDVDKVKYVLTREIFFKEEINVYVSDEGHISTKHPKSIDLPNEEKQTLLNQVQQSQDLVSQGQGMQQQAIQAQGQSNQNIRTYNNEDEMIQGEEAVAGIEQAAQEAGPENDNQMAENQQMILQAEQMPDTIPGFEMILKDKTTVQVKSINKIKKKYVKRVLLIGNKKMEEEYLDTAIIPIIHISFCHNQSPNKTYGIIHFIQDLVKAQNKFLALSIYDMQTNGQRKVLAAEGSIVEPTQFEKNWSNPGSLNFYVPNPALPNGGQPVVVDPSPLNQNINYFMQYFLQIVEYITGINSMMQGDPKGAPDTMGGVQSLQNFGTQRIKSFARSLEISLENLAAVVVSYLQTCAPRDKWIQYFDDDGNQESVKFLDMPDDLQFKVRVDIVNSLPTQKQLLATLLSSVSGQTKNQYVADALTKTMLQLVDAPEARKLAEDIDTVKQMEGQINGLQGELEKEKNRSKMLENNLFNKELSYRIALALEKEVGDIKQSKEKAKQEAINGVAGEVETEPIHMEEIEQIGQEPTPQQQQQQESLPEEL